MFISAQDAQSIADSMHDIIDKHINLMDDQGRIIASTDPARIGAFHEGASLLLLNKWNELIVSEESTFKGSRQGVNLPITISGETVGVIGITGNPDEVRPYGKIIKVMAEMMLMKMGRQEEENQIEATRNAFVEKWLFSECISDAFSFEFQAKLLGIDLTLPRTVVVLHATNCSPELVPLSAWDVKLVHILEQLRAAIPAHPQNLVVFTDQSIAMLLCHLPASHIFQRLTNAKSTIETTFHVAISGGISSLCENYRELNQYYQNAVLACQASTNTENSPLFMYDDISLALLAESIPRRMKQDFVNRVFANCTQSDLQMCVTTIDSYIRNSGSLVAMAQELFMHKNTIQHRLGRIKQITGLSPKVTEELFILSAAIHFVCRGRVQPVLAK